MIFYLNYSIVLITHCLALDSNKRFNFTDWSKSNSKYNNLASGLGLDLQINLWICVCAWLYTLTFSALSITLVLPPLFLFTICSSFCSFIVCASLFGLFTGPWVAAIFPIFICILGPDLLSSAFGRLTAIRGTAGLVGPHMAGFALDYFDDK